VNPNPEDIQENIQENVSKSQNGTKTFGNSKPQNKKKEEEENLHPSWIAKKKLKETQQSTIQAFAGEKIRFDNDDD